MQVHYKKENTSIQQQDTNDMQVQLETSTALNDTYSQPFQV
jgi:hypothetical protein